MQAISSAVIRPLFSFCFWAIFFYTLCLQRKEEPYEKEEKTAGAIGFPESLKWKISDNRNAKERTKEVWNLKSS
jgi:hypothetical protein